MVADPIVMLRQLVAKSGVKRQTISKWTKSSFDRYPDLETLSAIAKALEVGTFEIIAAMDGDAAVSVNDPRLVGAIQEVVEAALDERLGPRRAPPGRVLFAQQDRRALRLADRAP